MNTWWSRIAIFSVVVITVGIAISIYALTGKQTAVKETCGKTCIVEHQEYDSFNANRCNCVIEKRKQPQRFLAIRLL
jgi:hypothetical protein